MSSQGGSNQSDDREGSGTTADTDGSVEVAQRAQAALRELLQHMGMSADTEAEADSEQVLLNIRGDDAAGLVGKKGQTLDAIQMIVGKIVNRQLGGGMPLTVDANGYRARRASSLVELAHRLKDEAVESGRIVALNPMSARDRRVIHVTLRDISGVSTRSEGEGPERRLLIVPERR